MPDSETKTELENEQAVSSDALTEQFLTEAQKPTEEVKPTEETKTQETEQTKETQEEIDYKAELERERQDKAKLEESYKSLQGDYTKKAQELSKLKKEPETVQEKPEPLKKLEGKITALQNRRAEYLKNGFDESSTEVLLIDSNLDTLGGRLNDELQKQNSVKWQEHIDDFLGRHSELTPQQNKEIDLIMKEKINKGEYVSLDTAYEVWASRHSQSLAQQTVKNTLESKELAKSAAVQTGSQIETKTTEEEGVEAYYSDIEKLSKAGGLLVR